MGNELCVHSGSVCCSHTDGHVRDLKKSRVFVLPRPTWILTVCVCLRFLKRCPPLISTKHEKYIHQTIYLFICFSHAHQCLVLFTFLIYAILVGKSAWNATLRVAKFSSFASWWVGTPFHIFVSYWSHSSLIQAPDILWHHTFISSH